MYWVLSILDNYLDTDYFTLASYVFLAFILTTSIAALLRRLHYSGKTDWNILLILIPFIGCLGLLILLIMVGEPKFNKWGPYPKGVENN
jgi:uncharacterized membrane protein YhaH (DUF805 family)